MAADLIRRWFKRPIICRGPKRRSARKPCRRTIGLKCVHDRREKHESEDDELEFDHLGRKPNPMLSSSSSCYTFDAKGEPSRTNFSDSSEGSISGDQSAFEKAMLLPLLTPPSSQSSPPSKPLQLPPPRPQQQQQQQLLQLPLLLAFSSTHSMPQQRPSHLLPPRSLTTRLQTIFEESVISNHGCGGSGCSFSSMVATADGSNDENGGCQSDDLDELDSRVIFASDSPSTSTSSAAIAADTFAPCPTQSPQPTQSVDEQKPVPSPDDETGQEESTKTTQSSDDDRENCHSKDSAARALGQDTGPTHTGTTTTTCSSTSASAVGSLPRRPPAPANLCIKKSANSHLSPVVRLKQVTVQPLEARYWRKPGFGGQVDIKPYPHRNQKEQQHHIPMPTSVILQSSSKRESYGVAFALPTSDLLTSSSSSSPELLARYTDNRSNVYGVKPNGRARSAGNGQQSTVDGPVDSVAAARLRESSRFTRVWLELDDNTLQRNSTGSSQTSQSSSTLKFPAIQPIHPPPIHTPPPPPRISQLQEETKVKAKYNSSNSPNHLDMQFDFEAATLIGVSLMEAINPDKLLKPESCGTRENAPAVTNLISESVEQNMEEKKHNQELREGRKSSPDDREQQSQEIGKGEGAAQTYIKQPAPASAAKSVKSPSSEDAPRTERGEYNAGSTKESPFRLNNLDELCRGYAGCHSAFLPTSCDYRTFCSYCQHCNDDSFHNLLNSLSDLYACHCSSRHGCNSLGVNSRSASSHRSRGCCRRCPSRKNCYRQSMQSSSCCIGCRCNVSHCTHNCDNCCCCGCTQHELPLHPRPTYKPPNRYINPHSTAQFDLATVVEAEPLHWFAEDPRQHRQEQLRLQQQLHLEQMQTLREQWESASRTIGEVQRLCKEAASERVLDRQVAPLRLKKPDEVVAKSRSLSLSGVQAAASQPQAQKPALLSLTSASPPINTANKENAAEAAASTAAAAAAATGAAVMSALPQSLLARYMRPQSRSSRSSSSNDEQKVSQAVSKSSRGIRVVSRSSRTQIPAVSTQESLTIETSLQAPPQSRYNGADSNSGCSISVSSSGVKVSLSTGTPSLETRPFGTRWTLIPSKFLEAEYFK